MPSSMSPLTPEDALAKLQRLREDRKDSKKSAFTVELDQAIEKAKNDRTRLVTNDADHSWDAKARSAASQMERDAARIVFKIREFERVAEDGEGVQKLSAPFGNNPTEELPSTRTRDMGGQFLTNQDRINDASKLFAIAQEMPKGALLHLHFNAEIAPLQLIENANKEVPEQMFIASKTKLRCADDFNTTEIQVAVLPENRDESYEADIFNDLYPGFVGTKPLDPTGAKYRGWMRWSDFAKKFKDHAPDAGIKVSHLTWVMQRMVLSEEEVYDRLQTVNGIWARFNQGTRAFKGFLNYEKAFRWYVGAAIDEMVKDKIMYAELRPMWLDKNIPSERERDHEGKPKKLGHKEQIEIIIEEIQIRKKDKDKRDEFPFGLKIIYCTPRSIPKPLMFKEICDCIELKIRYPELICGFDLVGAEDRANHINFYVEELVFMQQACKALGPEYTIPFMFHAGETLLDRGGSFDHGNSNLYDAVSLGARRIGHGFSLPRHTPDFIKKFKKADICIELCPISNELLHLCRNAKEHPFPELLQAGIPCTLNSDNPSLFSDPISSSLSSEFYQVMVGWTAMNLHGWKQLALWSIEYSCLNDAEKADAERRFKKKWEEFCTYIVKQYGSNWNETKAEFGISRSSAKLIAQLDEEATLPWELRSENDPVQNKAAGKAV